MKVVIHAGAHETDEDRLLKCLIGNRSLLASNGTVVSSPSSYRKQIREFLQEAEHGEPGREDFDTILADIVGRETPDRLILSNYGFFGTPKMSIAGGQLYKAAEWRLQVFEQIFRDGEVELFMAIRNPATFIPAIVNSASDDDVLQRAMSIDPRTVRWSELFQRVRDALPDLPITVWCNEDTPLIWAELIREIADLDPLVGFRGEFELVQEIMTDAGAKRFNDYFASHPNLTENQKRRVIVAFLDKFADPSVIEEEVDIPGWTEELIGHLSDLYDDDVEEIRNIPGVNVITP